MLVLQVIQGADRGMRFELPAGEPQLIGRSSEALPISDKSVSRRHAELTPDDGEWWLRDLDSANGTYINGTRITGRVKLAPGDQIRCGSTLFVFIANVEDRKDIPVDFLAADAFDVTVHTTADASASPAQRTNTNRTAASASDTDHPELPDPNDDSMVLGNPDPLAAASGHLRVIYQLTALTATTLDRDQLLERIMDLIVDQFQPDRGFILLLPGPDAPPEHAVVRYRQRPRTVDEGRIPVSRTIIRHTLGKRQGILSTNAMNDSRFQSGDSVREYGIRSAICVPITAGRRIFGVIHIDSSMANFTFTEGQLNLLTAIGQHTGLALLSAEQISSKMHTERLAAMGQTVASLSHSIKNILQGLRGGADAVELAINRNDLNLAREGWPILARNLDRIYALTLNMLAYSRPRDLDIELADLHALIHEVAQLLTPQLDRKVVGLIHDLADDMPPVPADVNALHQALMNLLTNALDAVPAKKGVITVRTRYDRSTHQVSLTVADNGPGIPPELHEAIFEPFSSTKGQRGTGLGLAVTRKIIQEHGGRITLDSTPGQGAAFTITLPSDRPHLDAGETRLPRPLPKAAADADQF